MTIAKIRSSSAPRSIGSRRCVALLAAVLVVAGLVVRPSRAGFVAKVADSANSSSSRSYFTCTNAATGNPGGTAAYAVYPLDDSAGVVARDVSGLLRNGAYSPTGVSLGLTGAGVCPRDTNRAVTLNGVSGFVNCVNSAVLSPQTFTIEIWFRTSVAAGRLFGLSGTGLALTDRALYIGSSGRLRFGINTGTSTSTMRTVASAASVATGTWHLAAAALSSAGMVLYLDGAAVASDPSTTTAVSSLVTATPFWRIGFDSLSGWPDAPASNYFKGDVAFASVYTTALSAAQIAAQYLAGTP